MPVYFRRLDLNQPLSEVEIEEEEYRKLIRARDQLQVFKEQEESYELTLSNFQEWETELLAWGLRGIFRQASLSSFHEMRAALNRRLFNFLCSATEYRERTKALGKKVFGLPSEGFKALEEEFRRQEEERFAFRLMPMLRHYLLHDPQSTAVGRIAQRGWTAFVGEERRLRNTVEPWLQVEPFLEDLQKPQNQKHPEKRRLAEELKNSDITTIHLRTVSAEYMAALASIQKRFRELRASQFEASRAVVEGLHDREIQDGTPAHWAIVEVDGSGSIKDTQYTGRGLIDRCLELTKRNGRTVAFDKLFLVNEPGPDGGTVGR